MNTYAVKGTCPICRSGVALGAPRCSSCNFDFTTAEATQLWKALVEADRRQLAAVEASKKTTSTPATPTASPPPLQPPYQFQPYPVSPATPRPGSRVSAGTIFLILGALFVLVSGSILSALVLGPFALPLITALSAGVGYGAHRKGLRASTETMILVTAGFYGLTTSLFNPLHSAGEVSSFAWALVNLVPLLGIGAYFTSKNLPYLAQDYGAGLCMLVLGGSIVGLLTPDRSWSDPPASIFYPNLVAAAVLVGLAYFSYWLKRKHGAIVGATAAGVFGLIAVLGAYWDLLDEVKTPFVGGSLLVSSLLLMGSLWFYQIKDNFKPLILGYSIFQLLIIGSYYLAREELYFTSIPFLVFGFLVLIKSNGWLTLGLKQTAGLMGGIGLLLASPYLLLSYGAALVRMVDQQDKGWLAGGQLLSHWWLAVLAIASLTAGFYELLERLVKTANRKRQLSGEYVLVVGSLFALLWSQAPLYVLAMGIAIATAAGFICLDRRPQIAYVAVLPAVFLAEPSHLLAALLVSVGIFIFFSFFTELKSSGRRGSLALGGLYLGLLSPVLLEVLQGHGHRPILLVLGYSISLTAGALLLWAWLLRKREDPAALSLEGVAVLLFFNPLFYLERVASIDTTVPHESLIFLVAGAPLFLLAIFDRARLGVYKWLAGFFFGAAWLIRLVEENVETVELYTAPFALVFLGFGLWAMVKNKEAGSWLHLGTGSALLLVPSLLVALGEDFSIRSLYVLVLASTLLVAGARFKWRAPFLLAAGSLGFFALAELGPYTLVYGPLIPIAIFGVLFGIIGMTWESRVKDGKAALAYVEAMR